MTAGWDPIARDGRGAALSAGELCSREACEHRWLDHDHLYTPLGAPGFGWCTVTGVDGRCTCIGFVPAESPTVPPTSEQRQAAIDYVSGADVPPTGEIDVQARPVGNAVGYSAGQFARPFPAEPAKGEP